MPDPIYFCKWCDQPFANKNGLSIHSSKSKKHLANVARMEAVGIEPPDPKPQDDPGSDGEGTVPDQPIPLEALGSNPTEVLEKLQAISGPQPVSHAAQASTAPRVPEGGLIVFNPNQRPNMKLNVSLRTVKLLSALCDEHNDGSAGWWYHCLESGHDPYRNVTEVPESVPVLSDLDPATGRRKVLGREDSVYYIEGWNIIQAPFTNHHNGQAQYRKERGKGRVPPEERGVAPFCQFTECWVQDQPMKPLLRTPYGDFCIREQAQVIAAEATGTFLWVNSPERRAGQLAGLGV